MDVNFVMRDPDNHDNHSTLLHLVYYMNETAFAEYLISKGADKNATDVRGMKPMEYSGGVEAVIKPSEYRVWRRQIELYSQEYIHYRIWQNFRGGKLSRLE